MLPKLGPGRNSSERRESTRSLGKALAHSMVKMKHSGWGAEKDHPSKSTCRGRWGCFSWGRTVMGGRSGCCFRWAPVSKLDQNQDPVQSCPHRTGALPAGKRRRVAWSKQEQWSLSSWKGAFEARFWPDWTAEALPGSEDLDSSAQPWRL